MAFKPKVNVTAPESIDIPLVRADHLQTSNTFRICFEISIACAFSFLSITLSDTNASKFHWAATIISFIAMVSFGTLSYRVYIKATKGQ